MILGMGLAGRRHAESPRSPGPNNFSITPVPHNRRENVIRTNPYRRRTDEYPVPQLLLPKRILL